MRSFTQIVSLAILLSTANVEADVIYQFIEDGTGDVRATLDFDSTVSGASATSGWTAPGSPSELSALLEGGIGGFSFDFGLGAGRELASGGEAIATGAGSIWSSIDGAALDVGNYTDTAVAFGSGFVVGVSASLVDYFALGGPLTALSGAWVVQLPDETMPVPEPTTLWLFGLGLAGLGILRRKNNAHS